jgi:hypothetical protein
VTRIKGQLTTADYLPIAEYNRLVRGLEKDGEYLWETYCWLSFCTGAAVVANAVAIMIDIKKVIQ